MAELEKSGFNLSKYCKGCQKWLESSKFHCVESVICKECQLQRIKEFSKKLGVES